MALVHRILVATDFSASGDRAVAVSTKLAAQLGVPLVLLHVYATTPVFDERERWPRREADTGPVRIALEQQLGVLAARAREQGARQVDIALGRDDSAATIVRIARERECDLIVLGSPCADAERSVVDEVVRAATCPVLAAGRA
jgi:nucleotide-binding universal stress UspA family protein